MPPFTAVEAKQQQARHHDNQQEKTQNHSSQFTVFLRSLLLAEPSTEVAIPAYALLVRLTDVTVQFVALAHIRICAVTERTARR